VPEKASKTSAPSLATSLSKHYSAARLEQF
jgi:hypothetical protein